MFGMINLRIHLLIYLRYHGSFPKTASQLFPPLLFIGPTFPHVLFSGNDWFQMEMQCVEMDNVPGRQDESYWPCLLAMVNSPRSRV